MRPKDVYNTIPPQPPYQNVGEKIMSTWQHKDAIKYARKMYNAYGRPRLLTPTKSNTVRGTAVWDNIQGFDTVTVKDESVLHTFPAPHRDYVYSTVTFNVPPEYVTPLKEVSESIMFDELNEKVTARCHNLAANATTIQFVKDVVDGNVAPTKNNYKMRIEAKYPTINYDDRLNEKGEPVEFDDETGEVVVETPQEGTDLDMLWNSVKALATPRNIIIAMVLIFALYGFRKAFFK